MLKNKEFFTLSDGAGIEDQTDYERLAAMTDEEVVAAAESDLEAQPLTDAQLQRMRRLSDLPGNTLIEKLRSLADENKQLLSVRYDPDVIAFFKAQGKGYQRLMNTVLRNYMEQHLPQS